jgi:hypothetical protein
MAVKNLNLKRTHFGTLLPINLAFTAKPEGRNSLWTNTELNGNALQEKRREQPHYYAVIATAKEENKAKDKQDTGSSPETRFTEQKTRWSGTRIFL